MTTAEMIDRQFVEWCRNRPRLSLADTERLLGIAVPTSYELPLVACDLADLRLGLAEAKERIGELEKQLAEATSQRDSGDAIIDAATARAEEAERELAALLKAGVAWEWRVSWVYLKFGIYWHRAERIFASEEGALREEEDLRIASSRDPHRRNIAVTRRRKAGEWEAVEERKS